MTVILTVVGIPAILRSKHQSALRVLLLQLNIASDSGINTATFKHVLVFPKSTFLCSAHDQLLLVPANPLGSCHLEI